jgi:3-oxoacyl-[acyl-carrier-protein] synthase II
MELKRVVVTGLGAVTPLGNNIKEYWEGLINGVSGAELITRFNTENYKTKFACQVKNFDPAQHFDRKEIRSLDLFAQFALVAAKEAITDSGIDSQKVDKNRIGVIWTSGTGGIGTFQEELEDFFKGGKIPRFNPFFIPKMIPDIAAGLISIKHPHRMGRYYSGWWK